MCEENKIKAARYQESVELMASSHAEAFVEYTEGDPRVTEVLMDVIYDFMGDMLPIVSEEAKFDVGLALLNKVYLKATK